MKSSKSAMIWIGLLALGVSNASPVDQGAPGTQGAWPTRAGACLNPTQKDTSVSTIAINCPATSLTGRRFVLMCNSAENSSGGKIKIRYDGTDPVMGLGNPGDVLSAGQCITIWVNDGTFPRCISDQAATHLTSDECKQ